MARSGVVLALVIVIAWALSFLVLTLQAGLEEYDFEPQTPMRPTFRASTSERSDGNAAYEGVHAAGHSGGGGGNAEDEGEAEGRQYGKEDDSTAGGGEDEGEAEGGRDGNADGVAGGGEDEGEVRASRLRFSHVASFPSEAASGIAAFEDADGQSFIAVANYYGRSELFRFDPSNGEMTKVQHFLTKQAHDWEVVPLPDGSTHLLLSEYGADHSIMYQVRY